MRRTEGEWERRRAVINTGEAEKNEQKQNRRTRRERKGAVGDVRLRIVKRGTV
jgi:hypothetical protein